MYVLDRAKSFLPELKVCGNIQLIKTSVKMSLKGVGVIQIY